MNGIKAVLPGKNIDSTDPRDFAFSSLDEPLAVPIQAASLSGTGGYTFTTNPPEPGSGSTLIPLLTVPHDFGYVPASLVYVFMDFQGSNPTGTVPTGSYLIAPMPLVAAFAYQWIGYSVDDQQLIIYYQIDSGGASFLTDVTNMQLSFKYYLFSTKLE